MNKRINAIAFFLVILLTLTNLVFADGKVNIITEEEAIKIIGNKSLWTEKQFAKKANISLEELKKLKEKVDEPVELSAVEFVELLRAPGCSVCQTGKLIHLGNDCLSYSYTGNERRCNHNKRYGTDVELERVCQATMQCDTCGYSSTTKWSEKTWECHGYSH